MRLDGKIALVTGAGSGIGRALSIDLAARGAVLVLAGRRREMLEETRALLVEPSRHRIVAADLTVDEHRRTLAAEIEAAFGRLDLLVNNAGAMVSDAFDALPEAAMRSMLEINLLAPAALTTLLAPLLERSAPSRVVNVGSMFGDIAFPLFAAYSATKFGLRGWSEALRRELAGRGVGVTYAAPRGTRTALSAGFEHLAEAFRMRFDDPALVARAIVRGIERDARDVYPKGPERLFLLIQRLAPRLIDRTLIGQLAAVARPTSP